MLPGGVNAIKGSSFGNGTGGVWVDSAEVPPSPRALLPHISPPHRRLQQQLEVAKCKKAAPAKSPPKAPAPTTDALTFELFWRPEQDQFSQTAKVSVVFDPQGLCCPFLRPGVPTAAHLPADSRAGEAPGAAGGHGAL